MQASGVRRRGRGGEGGDWVSGSVTAGTGNSWDGLSISVLTGEQGHIQKGERRDLGAEWPRPQSPEGGGRAVQVPITHLIQAQGYLPSHTEFRPHLQAGGVQIP